MSGTNSKHIFILSVCFLFSTNLLAHNGKVGYAYPLGKIVVDGDFSDWPQNMAKYWINSTISDQKPKSESDFSAFFNVGYNLDTRSLYIAFTITDEDFIEDTSDNVRWNSQDGLELSIDGRHLPFGSGVASFMYSKKLRNTNHSNYDPFAKAASWKIMEVATKRIGNQRFCEWRIQLDEQLVVGKSIGLDFMFFDLDKDGSFTFAGWGRGERKYSNPKSLGDVILLPANEKLSVISGNIGWDKPTIVKLPQQVRLSSKQNKQTWVQAELDSIGNYSVEVPAGNYEIVLPAEYVPLGDSLFATTLRTPVAVLAKPGQKETAAKLSISADPVPDLIPSKGVLHNFSPDQSKEVDNFIESYQKYYGIPGVSLALIKDGKLVYHKTWTTIHYLKRRLLQNLFLR